MQYHCECYSYAARQFWKWRRWFICLALILAIAITIFVCFVFAPLMVKASIEDARLDSFSFTPTHTGAGMAPSLAYNISLALTVHNSNAAFIKYTKPLVATLVFHDRRLYSITAMEMGLKHPPHRTKLRLLHAGGTVPPHMLDDATVQDLKQQNATGLFKLEVHLSGEIAFPVYDLMHRTHRLGLSCPLSLPLAPRGPEVVVFRKVSCKLEEPQEIYF
ncbi:unnamed protein product [Alopecurus aequalis]